MVTTQGSSTSISPAEPGDHPGEQSGQNMTTTQNSSSPISHAEPGDLPETPVAGGEGGGRCCGGRLVTIDGVRMISIGGAVLGAGVGALGGPVVAGYCAAIGTYIGGVIGGKICGPIVVQTQSSSSSPDSNDQTERRTEGRLLTIDGARLSTAGGAILGAAAGSFGGPVVAGNCALVGTYLGSLITRNRSGQSMAATDGNGMFNSFTFSSFFTAISDYAAQILRGTSGNTRVEGE